MRRTHQTLATLALSLALVGATGAVAAAAAPPTRTQDQANQPKALDQSQLDPTLARHRALGALSVQESVAQRQAPSQSQLERTLARHRALGTLDTIAAQPAGSEQERTLARHRALGAIAAPPAARTDPAAPRPGVDVLATLLIGLVGGLIGGAAVMIGWTATTRRRRPRAVAGA